MAEAEAKEEPLINPMNVVASPELGELHARLQWYVDEQILPCCVSVVLRGSEVVDYTTFGYMDLESRRPLTDDAIFRMYSNTKIVTSVAAMMLHEQGEFALDDPLSGFLPAFAEPIVLRSNAESAADVEPLAAPITMRHVMSHSAGLSYGFVEPESVVDQSYAAAGLNGLATDELTLETLCDRLATLPLAFQPGTRWRYSFATDVLARVVEVISGQRFDDFLQARIFEPLDMTDTGFHVPADKHHRLVAMYAPTDLEDPMHRGLIKVDDPAASRFGKPRAMLSGGGGLVSTVADYVTFLRMLINGGEAGGQRLLKPSSIRLMRTNQLPHGVEVEFPMWRMTNTGFGLGFAVKLDVGDDEPAASLDEYHWGGLAGTHSWLAPRAQLCGLCMTQRMPGFWHPFSHEFKRMVYEKFG